MQDFNTDAVRSILLKPIIFPNVDIQNSSIVRTKKIAEEISSTKQLKALKNITVRGINTELDLNLKVVNNSLEVLKYNNIYYKQALQYVLQMLLLVENKSTVKHFVEACPHINLKLAPSLAPSLENSPTNTLKNINSYRSSKYLKPINIYAQFTSDAIKYYLNDLGSVYREIPKKISKDINREFLLLNSYSRYLKNTIKNNYKEIKKSKALKNLKHYYKNSYVEYPDNFKKYEAYFYNIMDSMLSNTITPDNYYNFISRSGIGSPKLNLMIRRNINRNFLYSNKVLEIFVKILTHIKLITKHIPIIIRYPILKIYPNQQELGKTKDVGYLANQNFKVILRYDLEENSFTDILVIPGTKFLCKYYNNLLHTSGKNFRISEQGFSSFLHPHLSTSSNISYGNLTEVYEENKINRLPLNMPEYVNIHTQFLQNPSNTLEITDNDTFSIKGSFVPGSTLFNIVRPCLGESVLAKILSGALVYNSEDFKKGLEDFDFFMYFVIMLEKFISESSESTNPYWSLTSHLENSLQNFVDYSNYYVTSNPEDEVESTHILKGLKIVSKENSDLKKNAAAFKKIVKILEQANYRTQTHVLNDFFLNSTLISSIIFNLITTLKNSPELLEEGVSFDLETKEVVFDYIFEECLTTLAKEFLETTAEGTRSLKDFSDIFSIVDESIDAISQDKHSICFDKPDVEPIVFSKLILLLENLNNEVIDYSEKPKLKNSDFSEHYFNFLKASYDLYIRTIANIDFAIDSKYIWSEDINNIVPLYPINIPVQSSTMERVKNSLQVKEESSFEQITKDFSEDDRIYTRFLLTGGVSKIFLQTILDEFNKTGIKKPKVVLSTEFINIFKNILKHFLTYEIK